jgi:thiol-disulfide isomerase/thioredoxin
MSKVRHRIPATAWIVLAGVVLWFLWAGGGRRITLRQAEEAPLLPALELLDWRGRPLALSELRGRVVLLSLWASWCGPCRREAPRLTQLQRALGDQGLVVVGLSAESLPPADLARLRAGWDMEYTVASATRPLAGTVYEGQGVVPHHWLVDRGGRLRASRPGLLPESALRRALSELLAEGSDAAAQAVPGQTGPGQQRLGAE